jgi:hypothetical protein
LKDSNIQRNIVQKSQETEWFLSLLAIDNIKGRGKKPMKTGG